MGVNVPTTTRRSSKALDRKAASQAPLVGLRVQCQKTGGFRDGPSLDAVRRGGASRARLREGLEQTPPAGRDADYPREQDDAEGHPPERFARQ